MGIKSTIEEIKNRFDNDVERFSNLETGQISTIDAAISLEIITESAKIINPTAKTLLDIGTALCLQEAVGQVRQAEPAPYFGVGIQNGVRLCAYRKQSPLAAAGAGCLLPRRWYPKRRTALCLQEAA